MQITEEKMLEVLAQIEDMKAKRAVLVDLHDSKIKTLTDYLQHLMRDAGCPKVESEKSSAYTRVTTTATTDDWPALQAFIVKNNAFDILQKRISPAALKRRVDAGELIKGVKFGTTETFIVQSKNEKDKEAGE